MHWRAQCHAKWQRHCRDSAPCRSQTHVSRLSMTSLNHSTIGSYQLLKKNSIWLVILRELFLTAFLGAELSISDSSGWIIKARQAIPASLNANLWSIHLIAFDIDWSWNFFTLHKFCSMLIEQLINLERVRTDNLKCRTDLRDRNMDGWSVTQ